MGVKVLISRPAGAGYISSLDVPVTGRPRRLAILGATGSIGESALRVAAEHPDSYTVIALAGSTGNSTGPHCHYEVRINGDAVDPTYFLPGNY